MGIFIDDSDAKTSSIWGGVLIVIVAIICYTWVVVD